MSKYALPTESEAYRKARSDLLQAEMALQDQREQVAALRRKLPPGPEVPDYVLREGPADLSRNAAGDFFDTRLSELFGEGRPSLIVMHFMFGDDWELGCPMCSAWADGYNGVQQHLRDHTSFAVVAGCELGKFREYARGRGWQNLRLLSSHGTSFTRDFGFEEDGEPLPGVSVFTKDADGALRLFYSGGAIMDADQYRGMDLLSPIWHYFDLLPEGRGEWFPQHSY